MTSEQSKIIAELDLLITQLKNKKDILGDSFCKEVAIAGKKFIKELSESVGWKILHKLHEFQPTEETLEAIITSLPSVLSVKNKEGVIPIHKACFFRDSVQYVGLLAREGVKNNLGGEAKRGGLLLKHPNFGGHKRNILLQIMSSLSAFDDDAQTALYLWMFDELECDVKHTDALKGLRKSGLLTAVDIIEHNLLYHSCFKSSRLRFEYLSNMCPEGLKMIDDDGLPIFHHVLNNWFRANGESMQLFLRAALKHFPNEVGLLFQQDSHNRTSLEVAISIFGKDLTFKVIRQCIPQDTTIPILHHVVKRAPQYIDDFIFHYPDAIYLRDEQGDKRTYFQARNASGNTTFAKDFLFLVNMSPDHIMMADPVTDLYPFMVAASGETSDLDTVFYLLKREPKLVYGALKFPGGRKRKS